MILDSNANQIATNHDLEQAGFDANTSDFADPEVADILDRAAKHPTQSIVSGRPR
jgi:hypothetical protein